MGHTCRLPCNFISFSLLPWLLVHTCRLPCNFISSSSSPWLLTSFLSAFFFCHCSCTAFLATVCLLCTCASHVCSCSWLVVSTFCGHDMRTLFIACSAVVIQQWSKVFSWGQWSGERAVPSHLFLLPFLWKKTFKRTDYDHFYIALFSTLEQIHGIFAAYNSKWVTVLPNKISLPPWKRSTITKQ